MGAVLFLLNELINHFIVRRAFNKKFFFLSFSNSESQSAAENQTGLSLKQQQKDPVRNL